MTVLDHLLYAFLWLSFGIGHSILAAASVKAALGRVFGRTYRFAYNVFAGIHIGAILVAGQYWLGADADAFGWSLWVQVPLWGLQALGLVILLMALRQYDMGLFAGTRQLRDPEAERRVEPLNVEGLNAWVRHPIYLGAHLLLWGGVSDGFTLATAVWGSLYLVIGARYEERRLVALYGDAYRAYQRDVAFLIPRIF
jgi:protein-S-isoprenylcysteine O-methyltransferase Ste14